MKRSPPQDVDRTERWLGPDEASRARRWAYEELLFGEGSATRAGEALSALVADLAADLAELRRMQNQLLDQVVRIAELEGRVEALLEAGVSRPDDRQAQVAPAEAGMPSFPSDPIRAGMASERRSALARCEGFRVDSPHGPIGFVEGLRFGSRIDQPDLLEVRGGRFGRQLHLIPIEAVDEISPDEERLVVRNVAEPSDDPLHEIVSRVREALHHVAS